ncbi:hypothetical protein F383_32172 [Gossypium arboreum]|uniref:Uncharacterized protein n=1 Tax=Gossypium arboreum TaxID=29729 RepID=A0A0B0MZB0_GOSAR|nr:hypothetical protein F383_32172 [Gossypium arboreum]
MYRLVLKMISMVT